MEFTWAAGSECLLYLIVARAVFAELRLPGAAGVGAVGSSLLDRGQRVLQPTQAGQPDCQIGQGSGEAVGGVRVCVRRARPVFDDLLACEGGGERGELYAVPGDLVGERASPVDLGCEMQREASQIG